MTGPGPTGRSAFRTDIQALRGFAVLSVLLYHARIGSARAGYLGVDVFFVLSGFLITRLIKEAIEAGTFRFSGFYLRRAKRLLPAAYVTFLATALLAPLILTTLELRAFVVQLFGALTLSGNVALWLQTGYFTGAAELKPLLHVWSLSLEEQYYLLLPAALVFLPRRHWARGAVVLLAVSLALCFALITPAPSATFYLLPTRAWELALGSVAALAAIEGAGPPVFTARLFWPAAAVLVVIPFRPLGSSQPGIDAVLVCGATLIVMLARHPVLNVGLGARALAKVGDFSYSLYLVHWPIFAFLRNAYLGELSRRALALAAAVALVLGYMLYATVELPVRRAEIRFTWKWAVAALAGTVVLVLLPLLAFPANAGGVDYAYLRRSNVGLSDDCEYRGRFTAKAACQSSPSPRILVWGDSFAMHLVPGIIAVTDAGVLQATRSTCGPFYGFAAISLHDARYQQAWSEGCLDFNQSVVEALPRWPSIDIVVLSGEFGKYLGSGGESEWRSVSTSEGPRVEREPSIPLALEAMRRTVEKIRSLGKRVVLVGPLPSTGFDIGICLERKATGKPILGVDRSCRVPVADYHSRWARIREFLRRLPAEAKVNVVDFDDVLCRAQYCSTELDGVFLYRDGGHLSYDGSRLIAERMGLGERLQAAAW